MSQKKSIEEKSLNWLEFIGLFLTAVVVYFMYSWFLLPLFSAFGIGRMWAILLSVFIFGGFFGIWITMVNALGAVQKFSQKQPSQSVDKPEDKLTKLKELNDSGVITQEEFEVKKRELLDRM